MVAMSAVMLLTTATACNGKGGGSRADDELSIFTFTGNEYDNVRKDAAWKALEEKTGFTISYQGASTANYMQSLNPKMNNLEFPDIIWINNDTQSFLNWANPSQDLIWNLDELLLGNEERYPYLTKLLYSDQYKNMSYYDGGHYVVPYVNTATAWAIYYRGDWLKQIGFVNDDGSAKVPTTLDEFEQVMKGFTGMNKFDNQQTWGLSPNTEAFYTNALYGAFDVTPDWDIDEAGNVSYMYTNEKIKPYLDWMSAMYKEGWIQPTYNENKSFADRDPWYAGKVGCIMTNGESHMEWVVGNLLDVYPDAEIVVGPPPVGTGHTSELTGKVLGVKGSSGFSNWGGRYGGYAIPKDYKNKDKAPRILDFLEYVISPEGSMLRLYGVEGTHYHMEDGKVVIDIEKRASERVSHFGKVAMPDGTSSLGGLHKIGSLFGYAVDWDHYESTGEIVVGTEIGSLYPRFEKLVSAAVEYAKTLKTSRLLNVTAFPTTISKKTLAVQDLATSYINPVIMGKKNLTTDWDKMIKDCNDAGYGDVQKIMRESCLELGIIS